MALSSQTTLDLQTDTQKSLLQLDVFHCILDCLTAPEAHLDQFSIKSRRVLFSLAQTCRAFSEPSLNLLWSKLDSLEPLIRCFATVLTEERTKTPPSPDEWLVIRRYSHRIRELVIEPFSQYSFSFLRATSLHPFLLVPNLRVLRWSPKSDSTPSTLSIAFIQRLLNSSLVSLSVSLSDDDEVVSESFIANLPILCPHLRSIHFNVTGRKQVSRTGIAALSQAILHYKHLESLDVNVPIHHVAFTHIVMSPKLEILTLGHHPDESDLHQVNIPSDAIPFRNVDRLSLSVRDLHCITTLLRTQDQKFRFVKLGCRSQTTSEAVFAFFTALASPQRAYGLQVISLLPDRSEAQNLHFATEAYGELSPRYHFSYDTLRPLTSIHLLRGLALDLSGWFSIDDDELVSLVRNWPFLEILQCCSTQCIPGYPWRSVKYVTFKGLLSLLECCPNLCGLALSVDAREVPIDTGDIVCNPALRDLILFNSPIGDPRSVQHILTKHFPSVTKVSSFFSLASGDDDPEIKLYKSSWDKVNTYLRDHVESVV